MYLVGAGGHSKVVFDILKANDVPVDGFVARSLKEQHYSGVPIIDEKVFNNVSGAVVIIAIGDNKVRKALSTTKEWRYQTAIHPSALVSKGVTVGAGTVIMHASVIQADSVIGKHVIVNTRACIDHDCIINDYVHIGPGAVLTGSITVGEGTLIGAGSVIIPGKKIGRWAVVGAGAVIIEDVPDHAVVVGNPGKIISSRLTA